MAAAAATATATSSFVELVNSCECYFHYIFMRTSVSKMGFGFSPSNLATTTTKIVTQLLPKYTRDEEMRQIYSKKNYQTKQKRQVNTFMYTIKSILMCLLFFVRFSCGMRFGFCLFVVSSHFCRILFMHWRQIAHKFLSWIMCYFILVVVWYDI